MYDISVQESDQVVRQVNKLDAKQVLAIAATTTRFAGTSVKVNLYRRGVFRSCVNGTCRVSPLGGVTILAETALTQERLCRSNYELNVADVLAMRPLKSRETDFDLRLELNDIKWSERFEKLPLPEAAHSISRNLFRRHLSKDGSPGSGEC